MTHDRLEGIFLPFRAKLATASAPAALNVKCVEFSHDVTVSYSFPSPLLKSLAMLSSRTIVEDTVTMPRMLDEGVEVDLLSG